MAYGSEGQPVEGHSKYYLGDETWSSNLLIDTCNEKLEEAIAYGLRDYHGEATLVPMIPPTIGYKYFNITFKKVEGEGEVVVPDLVYQLEYWSEDDQHEICTRVEPVDFVY